MNISFHPATTSEQIARCHQLQLAIFHHEMHLFGMRIPDSYDRFSLYMQILDADALVGTYRIVLANTLLGLPIEESGFHLTQFPHDTVCEMSRLVLLKEKRGKIPFSHIISSARHVAKRHFASILVASVLPRSLLLLQRYGFTQAGPPLYDPSVSSSYTAEPVVIPMKMDI